MFTRWFFGILTFVVAVFDVTHASAQSVVACRDRNMNIVPCESGGGSGYSGGGGTGGLYGLSYAITGGVISMFRSLLETPEEDIDAAAEQQRLQMQFEQDRQARLQMDEMNRRDDEARRQQQFNAAQGNLIGAIRPLGAEPAAASQPSALRQLGAIEAATPTLGLRSLEGASATAGAGFDRGDGPALPASGPLMQVQGVPRLPEAPPPPPAQPAATDPAQRPMTMDQRALVAEGKATQKKLDELRAKRAKGEVDAQTAEREESSLVGLLNALAARFDALTPSGTDAAPTLNASLAPSALPAPDTRPGKAAEAAGTLAITSCQPSDPAKSGCLEVRNSANQRVRIYVKELPGVFCTIEAGSMCSLPVANGTYHVYAEGDDGRRTQQATLKLDPKGVRWPVAFRAN
jgi:hypothetical protein